MKSKSANSWVGPLVFYPSSEKLQEFLDRKLCLAKDVAQDSGGQIKSVVAWKRYAEMTFGRMPKLRMTTGLVMNEEARPL